MKVTIERAILLKGLGHVQAVVERRNTIPILSNVLLEAQEGGALRLMATDLDLQVDESVAANVAQAGATTVSAHTLFDIIRKLPEGSQVELTAAEGKMQVNSGRSRFNLSTLPRDDFPVIAEGDLPTRFELPAATLRQVIDKTKFAISTEETRYYLMGIFLHVADDLLKAAEVDGAGGWTRLMRITIPLMKPAILVAVLFRTLDAFRIFDNIYVLTRGSNETGSVSILGYNNLFGAFNLGLGSAISILIFFCVAIIAFVFIKLFGASAPGSDDGGRK